MTRGAGGWLRGRARALTTPGGLFLTAALLVATVPATAPIRDPDFWWHLRTGQLIADRRALLDLDPFTYTASDHHWVMHEWLTEVLFAGLHAVGGIGLIVAVLSVVTAAGITAVFARAQLPMPGFGADDPRDGRRAHFLAVGMGIILASIAGYPIWGPRAQMETFALTCLTLLIVERHLRRGGRAVWLLVPMFLVWSNLHSGFIIGAAFVVAILVAEGGAHLLCLPGRARLDRVRTVLFVLVACGAIVVVNPNGPGIYLYPFETQGSNAQQSLIQEWFSPNFHDSVLLAFEFMLLSVAVMAAYTRRVRPRDAILVLATSALALQSVRHVALFIAAATPVWIEQADICGSRAVAWWRGRRPARTRRPAPSSAVGAGARPRPVRSQAARRDHPLAFRIGVLAICVGAVASVEVPKAMAAVTVREDSAFYASDYPVCATRWLAAAPSSLHLRIFNQYGEGGYLALHLTPLGDRVFIFGDAALMGDALLISYGNVEGVSPAFESVLTSSGTDLILFDRSTPLTDVLAHDARWTRIYEDNRSDAFVANNDHGRAVQSSLPDPASTRGSDGVCSGAPTVANR